MGSRSVTVRAYEVALVNLGRDASSAAGLEDSTHMVSLRASDMVEVHAPRRVHPSAIAARVTLAITHLRK
jgi:hypothetical protein